jgi:DHA1 family multidrug resistance protein-like MFS transporter
VTAEPETTEDLPAWRRLVALTFVVQLCSMMGVSVMFSFLPLYIETLGVGSEEKAAFWAGVMMFSQAIMVALFSPVWGSVADRYGTKLMAIRALFGAAIVYFLTSLVTSVYQLIPLFLVAGLFSGINTAIITLVSGMVPRKHLGSAIGTVQTGVFTGVAIGPLVGGVLADLFSYRVGLRAGALFMIVAGLLVLVGIHEPRRGPSGMTRRPGVMAGIRQTSQSRPLLLLIGIIFLIQFSTQMLTPVMPVYIKQLAGDAGNVATVVGLVLGIGGVGSALGAIVIGRLADRLGQRRMLGVSTAAGAIAVGVQALVGSVAPLAGARAVSGFFTGGLNANTNSAVGTMSPAETRGAAFGVAGSAFSMGNALGPLLGGALTGVISPRAVIVAAGIILLIGRVLVSQLDRAVDAEQATAGESDASPAAPHV